MKRILVLALLAGALFADRTFAAGVSLGLSAGISSPSETVEGENGSYFSVSAPVRLVPLVTVEPFFAQSRLGDQDVSVPPISLVLKGATLSTVGARVALTFGGPVSVYPYLGVGYTNYDHLGFKESAVSYLGGLGVGVSIVPKLRLDARAEQHTVSLDQRSVGVFNLSLGVSTPIVSLP
ncbi:MAG: hypothetical protein RL760_483 [Candidatus Eisenbacteria bacterium]